jgi:hypothetical protein
MSIPEQFFVLADDQTGFLLFLKNYHHAISFLLKGIDIYQGGRG